MTNKQAYLSRGNKVKSLLEEKSLEALVITSPANIRYLTGFAGSSGCLIYATDGATLLTDFRYVEEVRRIVKVAVLEPVTGNLVTGVTRLVVSRKWKKVGFESKTQQRYKKLEKFLWGSTKSSGQL